MTKKLSTRAPMELDLDSFLQLQSTSDDDDEHLNTIPHRTVDEILNDSDSSSSSSSSSNSFNTKQTIRNKKLSNSSISRRISSSGASDETCFRDDGSPVSTHETNSITRVSAVDEPIKDAEILNSVRLDERYGDFKLNLTGRRKSGSFSGGFGRGSGRPLPALFGGVKPNPKPGAALAAAAAASRSIPRSHAAAIKERRASSSGALQKVLDSSELAAASVVDDSQIGLDGSGVFKAVSDVEPGVNQLGGRLGDGDEKVEVFTAPLNEFVERDESKEQKMLGGEEVVEISHYDNGQEISGEQGETSEVDDAIVLNSEVHSNDLSSSECIEPNATICSPETVNNSNVDANLTVLDPTGVLEEHKHFSDGSENGYKLNEDSTISGFAPASASAYEENNKVEGDSMSLGLETRDLETGMQPDVIDGEVSLPVDDSGSKSEINEVFIGGLSYLDGKRGNKKSGKKSRSSMKQLELAEEMEKKLASSGLHWEEGAAAQPMRLEGIRRGPPAVGYLQIDPNNAITRTLSSQAFKHDHGSAQVLAVHANFIAVGMSKGLVLVVPSRYNAHNVDYMDAKMLWLASQGDKSHSPVTSMCFNQQGDLLLTGYGDGHLIIWDLQKVAIAKVISGEHTAPVVHTLFLGQDSTRQFKAVTGDCKGLVLLHSISVVPLLNRFTVKTQCLLDGQRTGTVLSASSLLIDDFGSALMPAPGNATASSGGIGSMMGGVVGGVLFSEGPSLVEEGVVIFVTHQNALVVRLSPALEFYAQLSKPEGVREGSMPYTAWKCMMRLRGSSTENIPSETSEKASLLAIAWDRKVQVAKLVKSELKVYREWSLDSAAIGVAWLDDQMLVVPTARGQLCLFSKEGNEIHRTSFALDGLGVDDLIAYHTHFTNIFGNPEKAYHNCVSVRGATIYILGPMHLVVSRLLPWKERIQVLRTAGDWMGALDMAMKLYDGNAHGVIDLPRTVDAIQEVIMPYLIELILSYVDEVFSYLSVAFFNQTGRGAQVLEQQSKNSSVHSEIEDQFARVGGVAVEFCVHIKRIDILFDDIFSKFVAVQQGGTFLELLEPYILKDMLGCLPPEIMQALVEHYSRKGWLQRVEQCVLHMDISSLDFNQVVRLCREHGLYGALIYLFNRGLDDFRTPLEELLLLLCDSKRENAATIGYRMLVYLKYCFSGLAFPPGHGTLPVSRLPSLRKELVQFLLEHSNAMNAQMAASFKAPIASCPNLYHLLWLDTEATLEVLRYAFLGEEILKPDHGLANENMEDNKENNDNRENPDMMVQNAIDALICILDSGISEADGFSGTDDAGSIWPSKKDIGHLLEFIAHFVACKQATISKTILNHTFKFLTSENNSSLSSQKIGNSKKREKQMLDLLKAVPDTDWDSSYILHLCERAKFYQVCGYIHTTRSHYVAALDSYMRDLDEPIRAFSFIHDMLLHLRDAESVTFCSAVIDRISELVDLSREGTFLLVIDHFHKESELILSQLQSHPKSLFLYLKTTIEVHLSGKLNFSSLEKGNVVDLRNRSKLKDQPVELKAYMERISNFRKLIYENPVLVNDETVELYLELLCQYERDSVLKFLETFENYRLEHCLRLCQEYGVIDAAAFLLERAGDVGNALLLTLSGLNEKLIMLDSVMENIASERCFHSLTDMEQINSTLRISEVNAVNDILHASIGLCQRNTHRLDPEESEFLWFQLLDSFCDPLRNSCDVKTDTILKRQDNGMLVASFGIRDERVSASKWKISKSHKGASLLRKVFSQFIREIVEGMIGYVRLPTVMAKLLSDNGDQEFGDFKLTILDMLGTYGFERRILDTAKSLIEDDTFYTMSLLKKGASHGYAPQNPVCCICSGVLTKAYSGIRLFNCGHATHLQCEFQESEVSKRESSGCPVCMPKKKSRRSKNKSVLEVNGLVKNSVARSQQIQGNNIIQHIHESDLAEKPYGLQQISRYEILNNLQKSKRSFQIENMPQLRLAPPAVYHEKVKKRTDFISGESSSTVKSEKPLKSRQLRELKMKGSALWSPLKSTIFGNEKTRSR